MFYEREINLNRSEEANKVREFLNSLGLKFPEGSEYTVGVFYGEEIVGTGSLAGSVLQGIGIAPQFQGEGISARIITNLMKKALEKGREHIFIFTKPETAGQFQNLGFKKIAEALPFAVLLEWEVRGLEGFKSHLMGISRNKPEGASCIVVNCNPFTMGHRYLIKKAARESPWLYILVVEEDRSLFPFHIRFRLIKEGVKDLKNLSVIPGGEYVISSATFPSYFTREEDLAAAQASLDLEVFSTHIAPPLKVIKRYVGEEPYCPVTSVYNRCMKELLPQKGIQVVEVPRLKIGVEAVSASRVRELIKRGEVEKTRELVPESTYSYLVSPEAREVIERIKRSSSRH